MTLTGALSDYRRERGARALGVAAAAAGRAPALDERVAAAGLAGAPHSLDELDQVAVLSKDVLPEHQSGRAFGGLLAEGAEVVRMFASPGPIYEPQLAGADPWRWAPALAAAGIGSDDLVLNCFSYHLSPAGMMFDEACRALGARVVPAGVGMTEVQARVVADLGVTAFIGLPSYLAALCETYRTAGLPATRWHLGKALLTAEPLPRPLRESLNATVAQVLMAYGTAEVGLIGFETEPDKGLRLGPDVFVELCDPETGLPGSADQPGEVVVSVLHEGYPLLRFGTGDVSRWQLVDGELRLAGVLGRVGAAVKVRGMFIHPHQAGEVLAALRSDGLVEGAFVVDRVDEVDVLDLEVVAADGIDPGRLVAEAERRCRDTLRVRPRVRVVPALEDGAVIRDRRTG
ncbi:MAG: phenylacetate--CoA ligase family protein [Actinomycetota bacterium]|nr:phenylacetate--CoA ligase family protein [Actinomycetota bacterium]